MRTIAILLFLAASIRAADLPTAPVAAKWELPAGAGKATALAWMPDRSAIVVGDAAGTVRVWNIATARESAAGTIGKAPVLDLAVSRDGKLVAAAAVKGVTLWDRSADSVRTVASTALFPNESHVDSRTEGTAWKVAFADSKTIAVLSTWYSIVRIGTDGTIIEKAIAMPSEFGKGPKVLIRDEAASSPLAGLGLAYYEGDEIDELRVWDYAKGAVAGRTTLKELTRPAAQAMSPDGRWAIVRDLRPSNSAHLLLFDVRSLKEIGILPLGKPRPEATLRAEFSDDGRMIFVAISDAPATVYDAARLAPLAHLAVGYVPSVRFSPDGRRIATGHADARVSIHDLRAAVDSNPPKEIDAAACWNDLVSADGAVAMRAVYRLADRPDATVKFIREKLKPVAKPAEADLAKWLAELGAPAFAVRQAASKKLAVITDTIIPELKAEAAKNASPEAVAAIDALLVAAERSRKKLEGDYLRAYRAVQVLETIGAPAKELLASYAAGAKGAFLTEEATRAVGRMK